MKRYIRIMETTRLGTVEPVFEYPKFTSAKEAFEYIRSVGFSDGRLSVAVDYDPCETDDPYQKRNIKCAHCGKEISFDRREVYRTWCSYVCIDCKAKDIP